MFAPLDGLGRPAVNDLAQGLAQGLGLSPEAMDVMGHAQSLARGDVIGAVDGLLGEVDAFEGLSIDRSAITGLVGAAVTGSPLGLAAFAADALGIDAKDIAGSLGLDGLARGIESFNDAVDGLENAIGEGLGNLGESIGEALGEAVSEIGEGLSEIGEALGLSDDDGATTEAEAESETEAAAADSEADADAADADTGCSDGADSGEGGDCGGDK